ncbi:MAG: hypothetical protein AAB917_03155 [Patescibacteria group bacterium]
MSNYELTVLDSLWIGKPGEYKQGFRCLRGFHAGSSDEWPDALFNLRHEDFPTHVYPEGILEGELLVVRKTFNIKQGEQFRYILGLYISPLRYGVIIFDGRKEEKSSAWKNLDFGDYAILIDQIS